MNPTGEVLKAMHRLTKEFRSLPAFDAYQNLRDSPRDFKISG